MTQNDLNQIGKLLEPVVKKLDAVWEQTEKLTEDMADSQITQEAQSEVLKQHTKLLKQIDVNTEGSSDNIHKLNKRLVHVENHIGIVPPPELTISR